MGEAGAGKALLAEVIAGLRRPSQGSLSIGAVDMLGASELALGRRVSYIGREPVLRTGTLQENLFYGLKQQPLIAYVPDNADGARNLQVKAERGAKIGQFR